MPEPGDGKDLPKACKKLWFLYRTDDAVFWENEFDFFLIHLLYSELHHFAWNACVSCPDREKAHKYLIVPGFYSGNVHIIDVHTDPLKPTMTKVCLVFLYGDCLSCQALVDWLIDAVNLFPPFFLQFIKGKEIKDKYDCTYPHTVHCIPSGEVMIHTLGNKDGDAKGNFYLLDGQTFDLKGLWSEGVAKEKIMGHDFWYQPRHNIMISTELGAPKKFSKGFDPADMAKGKDIHRSIDWLIDWLIGLLDLIDWLDSSIDCLSDSSIDSLIDWLID